LKDLTVQMAPKVKAIASSSSAAIVETQMGGASPQEAPISGKKVHKWLSPLETQRDFVPLTSS